MLYLAYGSNLHPARLNERVPSAILLGKAVIDDRVLQFHKRSVFDGSAKCNMATAPGRIYVAIYEMLPEQKPDLDRVEGLGSGYRSATIDVAGYGECHTYIATQTHIDDKLRPYSWYKAWVIVGCESLQFPQGYIDRIAAVQCVQDPDRNRHARQMRQVEGARNHVQSTRVIVGDS